ncbi:hypothetical protein [Magnetofaba australis]|uniref:Uncharacterized protein n=1 Tax=Magnetofaba australis IT-1 TaxID=1434232 RepID=A0A1Y2K9D9_9PROT|nr:hypothetical protein [Magnetofaba australis]OSM07352.1 hypothetical protein MAIT1_04679 [Magnetofaba australis IT-1]
MISLSQPKEPFDLDLPYGVTVTVKPLTTAAMSLCQTATRRRLEREYPEAEEGEQREGLFHAYLIQELAVNHITAWSGVGDDNGGEAPLNRQNVVALMDRYPMGERFYQLFTFHQVMLNAAKNGSAPSANGISSPAEGQSTAESVLIAASPAPEGSPD